MKFNFDEIVDRSQNYAAKFQEAELHYGTNDVIPLWIADMDFRTAPCIVDAIKARADQGIFPGQNLRHIPLHILLVQKVKFYIVPHQGF